MTILLTGAAGQLACAISEQMRATYNVVASTRRALDITDDVSVGETVRRVQPDVIINGAAYNDVDGAEDDPVTAMAINAFGVRALDRAAAAVDATLVHFSTDFVFDGVADRPYTEESSPNPQSVYAMSKLLGEWFATTPKHYVLRVASLFGGAMQEHENGRPRGSSLDRIADAILAGREVRAFEDRTVTPSYVDDVAEATAALLRSGAPYGLYHCVGSGMATWFEVASELSDQLGRSSRIVPVTMNSVAMKATHPRFCALSNAKLTRAGIDMSSWRDAVARYAHARLASGTGDGLQAP